MRFAILICFVALLLCRPGQAQDGDYPTLDALENLEVPRFDYAEMVERFSSRDTSFSPPASPPDLKLGDSESFFVIVSVGGGDRREEIVADLRAMTERVLIWVETAVDYPNWRAQALARSLESQVLDPVEALFQFAEPPGIDGDSRLTVVMIHAPEDTTLGYFPPASTLPQKLFSKSNEREMLVVNLALDDEYDFFDDILVETVAHEFSHILHHHQDPSEEIWLDEGLAGYAAYQASKALFSYQAMHEDAEDFLAAPNTGLTHWQAAPETGRKYGAASLFILYLTERFGKEIAARLLAEPADGWRSVDKALRDEYGASAEEVFADWVLANYFQDSRRGYGYRALDADLPPPQPVASFNSFPAVHKGELPQLSTDYFAVDVRGADALHLRLWQAADAQLIPATAPEGDYFAYAFASDTGNSRLTREFILTAPREAWLEFDIWYDLEYDGEYGYVTVSDDLGRTWRTLPSRYTTKSYTYEEFYEEGFNGSSRGWRAERVDLSAYTPGRVLIGFEVVSNIVTTYRGMAIDNLRIEALNFHEGFESPDDAWEYEGWARTDNRLPNKTWLQVAQDTGGELHVRRELAHGNGELIVDLLPGVSQVMAAVSPIAPVTSLRSEYELEAYLLDAAGEVLVVSRECSVTTTDPLNFRATPNGRKIGLLPEGTTVDALDKEGDWFQVEYNGAQGWVHGDYVNTAGECA